ncbi:MAG: DUF354 domain-containing protein [Methanosarcinaceae archaeon]|nr:DUF354 domain-containing protein [Methanosarcinaceae archaeon]
MKVVVDINHPAHVHLFKNFISIMEKKGHEVLITASEKDITFRLLNVLNLNYINLGTYGKSIFKKLINIPVLDLKMYLSVTKFNPDVFVSVGSVRAAHVAYIMRKTSIAFEDTEHCKEQHLLYVPFTNKILTPSCFKKRLGRKQVQYNGYHELAYLHPNYFTPNPAVLHELGLSEGDLFIILRFVSWDASHDIGEHGLKNKAKFVKGLEGYGRVLITSEDKLDPFLSKYEIKISPEKLHDLLYYATLYVGEGSTTASECAVLGTHAIFVNTLNLGCIEDQENYGLLYNTSNLDSMEDEAFNKARELLKNPDLWQEGKKKRECLLKDKIDVTAFMVKFIEDTVDKM